MLKDVRIDNPDGETAFNWLKAKSEGRRNPRVMAAILRGRDVDR